MNINIFNGTLNVLQEEDTEKEWEKFISAAKWWRGKEIIEMPCL